MNLIKTKKKWIDDESGVVWLIPLLIVMGVVGGIAVTGYAVYRLTQEPDVTYNITDTGFSLAGVDLDSLWIIVAVIGALIVLYMLFKKKTP